MAILVDTQIRDDLYITGSTFSRGGFTGSLLGTGSWASSSISASFSLTGISASFAISGSRTVSSSFTFTSSWAANLSGSFMVLQSNITSSWGTGSVLLNFAGNNTNVLTTSGSISFTSSNIASGRSLSIKVLASASALTFGFPSEWVWLGTGGMPTGLTGSKTGMLSLTAFGTAASDIIAVWANQV